jgi:Ca-activated chloride channel family protein
MLIAVIALIGAMARPNAVLSLPSRHDTVILAIDVSGSMNATDMQPTRLAAAQKAARDFITRQPRSTEIGVVAFANTAVVVQRPTANREDLLQAVDRLQLQDGTSVGGAILVSLQSLFPKEDIDLPHPNEPPDQMVGSPPAALASSTRGVRPSCWSRR